MQSVMTDVITVQQVIDIMREEILIFAVMFAISILGSIFTKNSRKASVAFLLLGALAGSLVAGMGIRFREIVEGPFAFLDSALSICCASLFVYIINEAGVFKGILESVSKIKNTYLKSFAVLLFIAFPAMLCGFATASVLTTGKLVFEKLKKNGADNSKAVAAVVAGSFLGMILPPNCVPAVIASNGLGSVLPTPYVGFFLPLLVAGLPAFVFFALFAHKTLSLVKAEEEKVQCCVWNYVVLGAAFICVLIEGLLGSFVYIGGSTLYFTIATIIIIAVNKGFGSAKNSIEKVADGVMFSIVPIAFMFALGSFIEVSSMSGVRGLFSLIILPYSVTNVMLVLMAVSLILGVFTGFTMPAFIICYAFYPIGWLANTVVVTGGAMALSLVCLISLRGSLIHNTENALMCEKADRKVLAKSLAPVAGLVLIMGLIMTIYGDNLTALIL